MKTLLHEKFLVNEKGRKTGVFFNYNEYRKLRTLIEEASTVNLIQMGEQEFSQGSTMVVKSLQDL